MTIRVPGRVVFLVPWLDCWIIGTTDVPDATSFDRPAPTRAETDELLTVVNRTFDVDLRPDDAVGRYAGLRPLVSVARGSTVRVSREHRVVVDRPGLVRISGGKFTTYRVMARDAVDAALGGEGRHRPSATGRTQLKGAADPATIARLPGELVGRFGLEPGQAERLNARYGVDSMRVAELGVDRGLLRPLGPGVDALDVEVVWAVRAELALSLDDVLAWRLWLATTLADRGTAIAPRVAELVGAQLGWDEARQRVEIEAYLAAAHREYDVPAVRAQEAVPTPGVPVPATVEASAGEPRVATARR